MQTKAVAAGDLTKTVTADVQGEILELKITVNDMVRLKDLNILLLETAKGSRLLN